MLPDSQVSVDDHSPLVTKLQNTQWKLPSKSFQQTASSKPLSTASLNGHIQPTLECEGYRMSGSHQDFERSQPQTTLELNLEQSHPSALF